MRLKISGIIITLVALFLIAPADSLGQSGGALRKESAPTPPPVTTREVDLSPIAKGMKTKIFEVKHRDPESLRRALSGLRSGEKGSEIDHNREFNTITVRDLPENIAVIEKALARLDQPVSPPVNLEVRLHLIAASRKSAEKTALPAGLEPVVAQLQSALQYSGYRYITTFMNRVEDGGDIESNGYTDPLFPPTTTDFNKASYRYKLNNVKLGSEASGSEVIQMRRFDFNIDFLAAPGRPIGAKISTDLNLREGEMVIVGTANIGSSDEAIIVVISVKKVK
jgi:hypothetical protein